jgi:hypothetical protein
MRNHILCLAAVILVWLPISSFAQTITLEGGGGYFPQNSTAAFGVSVQIPVYDKFSLYGSLTRLTTNDPRRAASANDALQRFAANRDAFVFADNVVFGPFWGNQLLSLGVTYTLGKVENFTFDVGAGWCDIERSYLWASLNMPDNLEYRETPTPFIYQSVTVFGLAHYALSPAFSLQGKLAFYGTTHGLVTVGICWKPF